MKKPSDRLFLCYNVIVEIHGEKCHKESAHRPTAAPKASVSADESAGKLVGLYLQGRTVATFSRAEGSNDCNVLPNGMVTDPANAGVGGLECHAGKDMSLLFLTEYDCFSAVISAENQKSPYKQAFYAVYRATSRTDIQIIILGGNALNTLYSACLL